jgi:hypothetical protein
MLIAVLAAPLRRATEESATLKTSYLSEKRGASFALSLYPYGALFFAKHSRT